MRLLNFLLLIILTICNTNIFGEVIKKNKLNTCYPSNELYNDYEPEHFSTTNNLLRKTGSSEIVCGDKIIIRGRLLDEQCVPIPDAKIYIWQAGCDGKYPYKPLRSNINKNLINLKNGSTFTGSGIATTNNNGEFIFITVYPTKMLNDSPHVNIKAIHHSLGILQTRLYISDDAITDINSIDPSYNISCEISNAYHFNIVMKGHINKSY